MKRVIYTISLIIYTMIFSVFSITIAFSQCGTTTPTGVNLICNGDFEQGDTCFATDYSLKPIGNPFSFPDEYIVSDDITDIHDFFSGLSDHTTGSGNMLMVDGSCNTGLNVWCQTVNIEPNTNYFFTAWLGSTLDRNPAQLQFVIDGNNIGTPLNAPATVGPWTEFTHVWFSGATNGPVDICIENLVTAGCNDGNDFALDDIAFTAGCAFGSPGPSPDLGPDRTLCGSGGSITLTSGIPTPHTNLNFEWSTGATTSSIVVNTPGTYSLCVDSAGSCIKTDVIEVVNDFSINLGPDVELCSPFSATLDAIYNGPGVTYAWYLNDSLLTDETSQTLSVNTTGTFVSEVTDPVCGTEYDTIVINSAIAAPNNAIFCGTNQNVGLSVTGSGNYTWFDAPTGGTNLGTGNTFITPSISTTTTYYVEDSTNFNYHLGPESLTDMSSVGYGDGPWSPDHMVFDAFTTFTLDSVTIYTETNGSFDVGIELRDNTGTPIQSVCVSVNGSTPLGKRTIPVGIDVPVGTDLQLHYVNCSPSTGNLRLYWNGWDPSHEVPYPYQIAGIASIKAASNGNSRSFGHFYDWVISSANQCDRIPVTAYEDCPLPVELLTFKGKKENRGNVLEWTTLSEVSNDFFTIEKSVDGLQFAPLGKLDGSGNTTSSRNYTLTDHSPHNGINYYRLKQTDFDGQYSYSYVIAIDNSSEETIKVYPTVFTGTFTIAIPTATQNTIINYGIIDALGKVHAQDSAPVEELVAVGSTLSPGAYFIKIHIGDQVIIKPIIKQ